MNNPGVLVERVFFRTMSVQTKKVPGRYGSPPRMVSVFVQDRTERLFRTKPNNKMIANLNNTSSINNVSESLARNNYRLERLEFLFENFRTADQWHVVLANIDRSTNLSYVAFDFSWGNVHRYTVPPAATEAIKQFFRILLQARRSKITWVYIRCCPTIYDDLEFVSQVANTLASPSTTLVKLELPGYRVGDEYKLGNAGAVILAQGLAKNAVLRHLDLSDQAIGDEGIAAIGRALATCHLVELCLSGNTFEHIRILGQRGLCFNGTLQILKLERLESFKSSQLKYLKDYAARSATLIKVVGRGETSEALSRSLLETRKLRERLYNFWWQWKKNHYCNVPAYLLPQVLARFSARPAMVYNLFKVRGNLLGADLTKMHHRQNIS
jgi:hypothetical protein